MIYNVIRKTLFTISIGYVDILIDTSSGVSTRGILFFQKYGIHIEPDQFTQRVDNQRVIIIAITIPRRQFKQFKSAFQEYSNSLPILVSPRDLVFMEASNEDIQKYDNELLITKRKK